MKATQTNYTYTFDGKLYYGSYLGRKLASRVTIVRVLNRNATENHIALKRQRFVAVTGSYVTNLEL